MVNETEKKIILNCAKKYNVSEVYLFGSSTEKDDYKDIDIGVKGIQPRFFFKFYTDLFKLLSKPVDLVDLSERSKFNLLIEEEGIKIYAKPL